MSQMEFLVADAQRQFAEAGALKNLSFWSFQILCRARVPSFQNPPLYPVAGGQTPQYKVGNGYIDYCAWHRYSDFEWLRAELVDSFPGYVIPPIPPKDSDGTVDKMQDLVKGKEKESGKDHPVVGLRIRLLTVFLQSLVDISPILHSEHLRAFVGMDEYQWVAYRKHVDTEKAKAHSSFNTLKTKAGGIFNSFGRTGDILKAPVFDRTHEINVLKENQLALVQSLETAYNYVSNLYKNTKNIPKTYQDLDAVCKEHSGKPLPPTLLFDGHHVSSANHPHGIIRTFDDTTATVDWCEGQPPERVPAGDVLYSKSGIVDPVIMAAHDTITQIESFFTFVAFRQEAAQLERLHDQLLFWKLYTRGVLKTIDQLCEFEIARRNVEIDAQKEKKPEKKAELDAQNVAMQKAFQDRVNTFQSEYAQTFRPQQRHALHDIIVLAGHVGASALSDNDWPGRLQRAMSLIPSCYDSYEDGSGTSTHVHMSSPQGSFAQQPPPCAAASPNASFHDPFDAPAAQGSQKAFAVQQQQNHQPSAYPATGMASASQSPQGSSANFAQQQQMPPPVPSQPQPQPQPYGQPQGYQGSPQPAAAPYGAQPAPQQGQPQRQPSPYSQHPLEGQAGPDAPYGNAAGSPAPYAQQRPAEPAPRAPVPSRQLPSVFDESPPEPPLQPKAQPPKSKPEPQGDDFDVPVSLSAPSGHEE